MGKVNAAAGSAGGSGAAGAGSAEDSEYKQLRKKASRRKDWKKRKEENAKKACSVCGRKANPAAGLRVVPDHKAPFSWIYRHAKNLEKQGIKVSEEQMISMHNDPSNLRPLCHGNGGCNNSRGDAPMNRWALGGKSGTGIGSQRLTPAQGRQLQTGDAQSFRQVWENTMGGVGAVWKR